MRKGKDPDPDAYLLLMNLDLQHCFKDMIMFNSTEKNKGIIVHRHNVKYRRHRHQAYKSFSPLANEKLTDRSLLFPMRITSAIKIKIQSAYLLTQMAISPLSTSTVVMMELLKK
jgi:hypothetical protein